MKFAALLVVEASGHAMMYEPPSRNSRGKTIGLPACAGAACLWFNEGSFIGCPVATGLDKLDEKTCPRPAKPTIAVNDTKLGTVFSWNESYGDWTKLHPWRYPGAAPLENPCGLMGGWYFPGPSGTGGEATFGFPQGFKGTEISRLLKRTTWVAGSTVEASWGITANHGGGYQYRLCRITKASVNITAEATEDCFQQTPMEFVGDTQWIQYGNAEDGPFGNGMNPNNRVEINATRVREGTLPRGSTWTRNPVPACNDLPRLGGHNHPCEAPMFPPPADGIYGFGPGSCASGVEQCTPEQYVSRLMPYGIVDKLRVPNLPAGDYIVSFRWDCEQLPQIWSNCADVSIVEDASDYPERLNTKPFSKWDGCEACCEVTEGLCKNCTKCTNDKTGDCAYCWTPLAGAHYGASPPMVCLGAEGPDGGAGNWKPGINNTHQSWSPGCTKCWAQKDSCIITDRERIDPHAGSSLVV